MRVQESQPWEALVLAQGLLIHCSHSLSFQLRVGPQGWSAHWNGLLI